ncbi:MAG TPA: hypothetical protein VH640_10960 [Bryobacteraceae bacterium]|jgi:hypothetical protein
MTYSKTLPKKSILIPAYLFFSAALLVAEELTGVVYADHSGPSGHSVGEIQLATKKGLVSLGYQKPVKQSFSNGNCRDLGAIWTVRTDASGGALIRARCNGRLDRIVHSAWLAVRAYIEDLANAAGEKVGYRQDRRGQIKVQMNGLAVDIAGYLNFGGTGMCLEVDRRIDDRTVIIRSSADCYFSPELDFKVHEVSADIWHVVDISAVDSKAQ